MRIVNSEWSRLQISASVGRMLVSVKIASKILHFSLSCEFVRKKTNISNLSNSFEFKRASHRGLDPDPTPDHLIIKQK
jgi:hypothetical protein